MKIGTKAENLFRLQELGLYVPEFIVVDFADVIQDFMGVSRSLSGIAKSYLRGKLPLDEYTAQTGIVLGGLKLDEAKVKAVLIELSGFGKVSFRTSALGEDGPKLSFAGQYQTFLDKSVSSSSVRKYIRACFASTVDAKIINYLKKHGAVNTEIGGSVIIQQMFYGEKCGVLFTEDGAGNVTINAVDSWRNTVVEGNLTDAIRLKKTQLDSMGISKALKTLAKASVRLENEIGLPLDIEWAVRGDTVAFLQMRPQTTHNLNYFFEWDSTNISESYPGITMPLTYSFIRNLYANVYPAFLSMIGTPKSVLEENAEVFNNALGLLNGQVYYRISNWYEIVKLIPGKNNQQYFEAMLNPAKKRNPKKDHAKFDFKSAYIALRFGRMLLTSPHLSKKFKKVFNERFPVYDNSKMEFMNASALLADIQSVQKELLSLWAIPILNDVRVMIWHGILKKMVLKEADHDTYLALLKGLTQQSSIKPLQALSDLGIKLNDEMVENKITSVAALAKHTVAINLARNYILEYGARTPDELKLENPRLVDNPIDVMSLALKAKDNPVGASAKSKIDPPKTGFGKGLLLNMAIKNTRSAIDWREHFRLNRAQVYNLARRAYLRIGELLVTDEILDDENDIFFLTDFEIENIINGHAWEYAAQDIVNRRKKQYKEYETKKLSRRITGDGIVAARHLLQMSDTEPAENNLTGIGVSPGVISAKIVVATKFNPNLDVRGKILVATHIDPGWTLIFTQAIGVITERGNALSHVSIITRELGIPAVVAAGDATKRLRSGQTVTINGSTGEVIINDKN